MPLARKSNLGLIDPIENRFSAFVFKIQANMNKAHRDRIAFMRICSGKFEAGMEVYHVQGGEKITILPATAINGTRKKDYEEACDLIL